MSKLVVKVPVALVIAALEKKEKEIRATLAAIPVAQKEYEAKRAEWEGELLDHLGKVKNVVANKLYYSCKEALTSITVEYAISGKPAKRPTFEPVDDRCLQNDLEVVSQSIRLLKMTDEEFVSASTLRNISQYL